MVGRAAGRAGRAPRVRRDGDRRGGQRVSGVATRVVVVDTVAPTAVLAATPAALIATNAPAVGFSANEAATFECRIERDVGAVRVAVHAWAARPTAVHAAGAGDGRRRKCGRGGGERRVHGGHDGAGDDDRSAGRDVVGVGGGDRVPREQWDVGRVRGCIRICWSRHARARGAGHGPSGQRWSGRAAGVDGQTFPRRSRRGRSSRRCVVVPQTLALTVGRQSLATVLKRGLTVTLRCARSCRAAFVLNQGKKVLVRTSSAAGKVVLKLPASTRRALARSQACDVHADRYCA